MSARLFRRIKSTFSRLNKTLLLSAIALALGIFLIAKPIIASAQNISSQQATVNNQYSAYVNNFTSDSGLSGGTVQQATSNNDAVGLVFTINLKISLFNNNDTIKNHWDRVNTTDSSDYGGFLIELCQNQSTSCWLSTVSWGQFTTPVTAPNGSKYQNDLAYETTDTNGHIVYIDNETAVVNAFNTGVQNSSVTTYSYNPATNTSSEIPNLTLVKGTTLTASLWYCASGDGASVASNYKQGVITNPQTFGSLCGGSSYYQIGGTVPITVPTDASALQQQVANSSQALTQNQQASSSEADNLPACGIGIISTTGTINGCVSRVAYGIYYLTEWVAALFGELFDFFIGYSLSDAAYRYSFAVTGWQLVRDVSNIFFIIILVYTGFSAVFNTEKTSMKQVIPNLIVNAILINFSLLATRVVIDISNITARMFYSEMVTCQAVNKNPDGSCNPAKADRTAGYWALSEAIVGAFNPQQIFQASVLQASHTTLTTDTASQTNPENVVNGSSKPLDATDQANYFTVVCLIAAALMVVMAIMFFKVAFLFVGRVVGLYICMIFSPFAFLSRQMPLLGNVERLRWTDWLKELTNYAMLAPVFVFFLYVIYILITSNFVQQIGTTFLTSANSTFFEKVISVVVPMLIIYFLLQAAQKSAEKLSGDIGKAIQSYGEKVTGFVAGAAVGVATGGSAYLGRNVVGRVAKAYGNGGKDENGNTRAMRLAAKAPNSTFARWQNNLLSKSQTGSWDVRNVGLGGDRTVGGTLNKGLGVYFGKNLNYAGADAIGLSQDKGKGGIIAIDKKRTEARQKKNDEKINFDHLSKDDAKKVWEQYKKDQIEKAGKKTADETWEQYIDKDAKIVPVVEAVTSLEAGIKGMQAAQASLAAEAEVLKNTKPTTASEASSLENKIAENRNKQADTESKLAAAQTELATKSASLQTLREQTIADHKKNGTEKNSAAYETALANANDTRKKELDSYGDIKDGKSLTTAMRAEYAQNLINNSFWMKDGKPRLGPGVTQLLGSVPLAGAVLEAVGASVSSAIFGALGVTAVVGTTNAIGGLSDMVGGIHKKAAQASIDAAKKNLGKGSELGKLQAKLSEYDKQIVKAAEEHLGKTIESVDKLSEDELNRAVAGAIATSKVALRKLKSKTTFANDAEEIKNEMDIAEQEAKIYDYQRIKKSRDDTQEKISKINKDNTEKEQKNNKS